MKTIGFYIVSPVGKVIFNEREAAEDIEISLAALEHRAVNIAKRSSPNMKQDAFGNYGPGGRKNERNRVLKKRRSG